MFIIYGVRYLYLVKIERPYNNTRELKTGEIKMTTYTIKFKMQDPITDVITDHKTNELFEKLAHARSFASALLHAHFSDTQDRKHKIVETTIIALEEVVEILNRDNPEE